MNKIKYKKKYDKNMDFSKDSEKKIYNYNDEIHLILKAIWNNGLL